MLSIHLTRDISVRHVDGVKDNREKATVYNGYKATCQS